MNTSVSSHSPGFLSAVHTAPSGVSVYDAARIMHWRNVGVVVVVKDHRPVGIVTDRDLAIRVVAGGLDPRSTTLGRVMTAPVVTASAEATDEQVSRQLEQVGVCQVPLVDRTGHVLGVAAWVGVAQQGDSQGAGARLVRSTILIPMVKRRTFGRTLYSLQQDIRQHLRWIGATVALAMVGAVLSLVVVGEWNPWSPVPVLSLHVPGAGQSSKPSTGWIQPSHADQPPAPDSPTSAR